MLLFLPSDPVFVFIVRVTSVTMCPDHLHPRALTTDQNIVKLSPRVFKVQSNIAPERTRPPTATGARGFRLQNIINMITTDCKDTDKNMSFKFPERHYNYIV